MVYIGLYFAIFLYRTELVMTSCRYRHCFSYEWRFSTDEDAKNLYQWRLLRDEGSSGWGMRLERIKQYCHVYECYYRRGMNWWMDLLTTYRHDSELQAITAPPPISTIQKITTTPAKHFFQPAVSSPAVPWQRLLTGEILQLHALRSSLLRLPWRTQLNSLFQPSWL
jgi:hypothetical protein